MSDNKVKAKKNVLFLTLSQIVTIAFGIVMPRITLVGYGSDINGLLNSVNQIVSYLALFEAGIQAVAKQSLYRTIGNRDTKGTNGILSAVNTNYKRIGSLYFLCLLGLSLVYPFLTKGSNIPFFTVFLVVFFSGIGNVITFFVGGKYQILLAVDGKSYILTLLSTISSILSHLVKIILLLKRVDIEIIIIATWLVSSIQVLCVLLYVRKKYPWVDLREKPNTTSLKQSKYAFIHQVSAQIFAHIDVLLLTVFCDLKAVSVYSIYKMLVYYLRTVLVIPLDSTTFALGQLYNRDKAAYIKSVDTLEVALAVGVFSVYTVALYLILPFIRIYTASITDTNYIDAYLPILFVLGEILNIIRAPMNGAINYAGHFQQTVWRSVLETVINLVASICGVIVFGIYGVLLGTIAALLYRTLDIIIYANVKILNRSPIKTLMIYAGNFALMILVSVGLRQIPLQIQNYFQFFCAGAIITPLIFAVFALAAGILYPNERKMMIQLLKNKKKFVR